jgi:hypothetical protein
MATLICGKCGASQPEPLDTSLGYPDCDQCGARAWRIDVTIVECAEASSVVLGMLTPGGDTGRDWKQRWRSIQTKLESLCRPSMETMTKNAILSWRDRLCGWYVDAYQLKDALKSAAPTLGIDRQAIEKAINDDPRLALLADLANQEKHSQLDRSRSGYVPNIEAPSGSDVLPRGWLLKVDVTHDSRTLDGLQIARDAVIAWRQKLEEWGLMEERELK